MTNPLWHCSDRKGQNIIEYLLLTVAVVLVVLYFTNTKTGVLKTGLENIFDHKVDDINRLKDELKFDPPSP